MAKTKSKQSSAEDLQQIQSDVASFASSLGLASSLPSSGFNDSDFRPPKKTNVGKPPGNAKLTGNSKPHIAKPPENAKPPKNTKPHVANSPEYAKTPKNTKPHVAKPPQKPVDIEAVNNYKSFERFKNLPKLPLVKASALGSWHVNQGELEEKVLGGENKRLEIENADEWKKLVAAKKELGERLLAQYSLDYEATRGQSSDIKMLITTQRSGTATDKVSAYSVLIGDNPIANMRSLDALLAMVTSKVGKRHALTGFEALKELFVQSLLPDNKLKTLFQRPINQLPETKDGYSLLLFWYWEECLKLRYERFVGALEDASKDMLRILKDKSLKIMYALLKSKSEQERRLLTALVNKLGDPDNKAASNADFYLTNLLSDHPNMKIVVIDEVDTFLFRPHLGLRSKYHAINFLSQIRLNHRGDGPKVAKRLAEVYFALFKVLIAGVSSGPKDSKSKDIKKPTNKDSKTHEFSESHVEMDSRLLSALLTGVNRAFPFVLSNEADELVDVHTPMLFQLVHSQNFNVGIQALMLIDKISSKNQVVSDRFYRALYAKLLLPAALNTSKAEMFIGLLLRAMKNDINLKRVSAFAKRLLQVALQQPSQYACGCLFLLSEVLKSRPPLWNMAIQNEAIDEDLEHFQDVPDENENLPVNETEIPQNDDKVEDDDSDSESSEDEKPSPESSSDDDELDEDIELLPIKKVEKLVESNSASLSDPNANRANESSTKHSLPGGYDPRHREPTFCNADNTSWWELTVLASHAHPSVSTMARTLLSGANIVYNGNPLNDLSLTAFLDKFMEKKPKQSTWHGGSQIEPAKKLDMNKHLIGSQILSLAEDDVPPEDVIFHKFYMNKMGSSTKLKKKQKKKKKKAAEEEEAEELFGGGDDESDNEEIDNLLDSTDAPALESDNEYDYDDLENVANEDDDDLVGNGSDNDTKMIDGGDDDDVPTFDDLDMSDDDDDDDDIDIGDEDDDNGEGDDDDDMALPKKGMRRSGKRSSASPFASLEEYAHLLNDDDDDDGDDSVADRDEKVKSRKKRKFASNDDDEGNDGEDGKKGRKDRRKTKRKKGKALE